MADIVLKDRNGNPVEYPGIDRIKLNTTDGGVQNFGAYDPDTLTPDKLAKGVTVGDVTGEMVVQDVLENLPISLDFSSGDQTISAPDGMVVKSAVIQKPDTLTPVNIAEGVNIAGIIGTLAAGGGIAFATGTVSNGGTISHNLGVVPDIIIAFPNESVKYMAIGTFCLCVVGFSSAFIAAYPEMPTMFYATYYNATSASSDYGQCSAATLTDLLIDVATSGHIHSANASTAVLSSMRNSTTYRWLAVGGLT